MKFTEDTIEYLKGNKFVGTLNVKIKDKFSKPLKRIDFLVKTSINKKVIHVGCADHIPLIETKIADNIWLHKRLVEVSDRCFGIDIDQDGIEYIKNLGYQDIAALNIIEDEPIKEITETKWDYMILGEILEHVDNPVSFLNAIKKKYSDYVDKIIITVPNGLRFINFKNVIKSREAINSDHRFWFTPYTLGKICTRAGLNVKDFFFTLDYKMFKYSIFTRILYRIYPAFLDNLIIVADLKTKENF